MKKQIERNEKKCEYTKLMCLDINRPCVLCVAKMAHEQGQKEAYKKVMRKYCKDISKKYHWQLGSVSDDWFKEQDRVYLWLEGLSK